jgi:hypothetical protein
VVALVHSNKAACSAQAAFLLSGSRPNGRRQIAIRKPLVKIWRLQLTWWIDHAG